MRQLSLCVGLALPANDCLKNGYLKKIETNSDSYMMNVRRTSQMLQTSMEHELPYFRCLKNKIWQGTRMLTVDLRVILLKQTKLTFSSGTPFLPEPIDLII